MITKLAAVLLIACAALAPPAMAAPVVLFCTATNIGGIELTNTYRLDVERGVVIEGFVGNDPEPLPLKNAPLTSTDRYLAWQWKYKGRSAVHFMVDRNTLAAQSWSDNFRFEYLCTLLRQRL